MSVLSRMHITRQLKLESSPRRNGQSKSCRAIKRAATCQQSPRADSQQQAQSTVDLLRAAPLVVGAAGVAGVVLNRAFSGVAPIVTASSSQSRADVLAIALSAVLLLTGLQWLAIKPRVFDPVQPEGEKVAYLAKELPPAARRELEWAWAALQGATSASCLAVFVRGKCVAYLGFAAPGAKPAAARPGPICQQCMRSGAANYLGNLKLFPGRQEFTAYMPDNTQAAIIQPLGSSGVVVVGSDTQRGFTRLEQAWLTSLADKLEATLELQGFAPAGTGFA